MKIPWLEKRRGLDNRSRAEVHVTERGLEGDVSVPDDGDGRWAISKRDCGYFLSPDESSHYLYFVLPERFLRTARQGIWIEVEYFGQMFGLFCLHYASTDRSLPHDGLYKVAEQLWNGQPGARRMRRALYHLRDFDPDRRQNQNASLRLEFRQEILLRRLSIALDPPTDMEAFSVPSPNPDLRKLPGRRYPINYLFLELTNACNFKCAFCPDGIMRRKRGFMPRGQALRLIDEAARKRAWLGPLFPVKVHQMGEPLLHPDLVDIVRHAESSGVPIELNTNCGLITKPLIDALYDARLTHLILSYQTPDAEAFRRRKAPRLTFDAYLDRVRLAVERKFARGAVTKIEIDVMNTKNVSSESIVSEESRAVSVVEEWIGFCRELEKRHGLPPMPHDPERLRRASFLDQCEDDSRYELLPDVSLLWKRLHNWSNTLGPLRTTTAPETYCPLPYDQLVIQWNGDAVLCCTDHEGDTRFDNAFGSSLEEVWTGERRRLILMDMIEGRLLDICARCQGRT